MMPRGGDSIFTISLTVLTWYDCDSSRTDILRQHSSRYVLYRVRLF